jgi:hypothetical protein
MKPIVKHGGRNIMDRGYLSYNGITCIRIKYANLSISVKKMNLNNLIFQQDNYPKHTSRVIKEYFDVLIEILE